MRRNERQKAIHRQPKLTMRVGHMWYQITQYQHGYKYKDLYGNPGNGLVKIITREKSQSAFFFVMVCRFLPVWLFSPSIVI